MEDAAAPAQPARFGAFEVDLRAGELRRQGRKIKLQEQPLQVLAMLLQRPGEVVTREELRAKLWPADTFVDFDHGLNKAINKIREALGDSADNPRFIETLPRRGYRFIAPVAGSEGAVASIDSPSVETVREALFRLPRGLARGLFLLIQLSYLVMYGIAFHYLPAIRPVHLFVSIPHFALFFLIYMLCGAAVRIYLFSAVSLDFPGMGGLFRRLFPVILILDAVWATSPLLLFQRLGEVSLLFVVGLAFLPFSQRTLTLSAYAPGPQERSGGKSAERQRR